jgi:hypothetical protein
MSISICEMTTTLIILELQYVYHFIEDTVLKLKLIYDRQSVGQSVLVSGAHLGPVTNFCFSSKFPSDS